MATEKGELHTSDEFSKAKRHLLWACSIAILLWAVQSDTGTVESPMLGTSAKIGVNTLRGAFWVSCLYFLIGFYRQVRNVERTNSQLLYAVNLENMSKRLEDVAHEFRGLARTATEVTLQIAE